MTPNDPAARLATETIEQFLAGSEAHHARYLTDPRFFTDTHLLRHFCAATIDELSTDGMPGDKIRGIIANVVRHMMVGDRVEPAAAAVAADAVPPMPTQPPITPVLPLTDKQTTL